MSTFDEYAAKYTTVRMERQDGILQLTLHTAGRELHWTPLVHGELPRAFHDVASDRENRIVILTGTGDAFSGPRPVRGPRYRRPAEEWDLICAEGRALLQNLLAIEVPMICAVNGPALRHSELALLCDIVLASETAVFEDSGHFANGAVPGDGVNIIYPLLMGLNRGRYFLLMSQVLDARQALDLGLVNEVLPHDRVLARAWEIARHLAQHPPLHLKHTRRVLTEELRRRVQEQLGYSLALEAMANQERPPPPAT